jgi:RNA polymerase sigma-70 factor (ECF subfamily)
MMGQQPTPIESLPRELAEARLSRLYREHGREIMGYALRRAGSPEEAADAVAETFLVAWRRLGDVPRGAEARLWLYGTARLVLANQRRAERRRTRLAERLGEALRRELATHSPSEGHRAEGVRQALLGLGDADRELLRLVAWEELTPAQAARVLGISALAARSRLHRARRRLQTLLGKEQLGESGTNELKVEEAR